METSARSISDGREKVRKPTGEKSPGLIQAYVAKASVVFAASQDSDEFKGELRQDQVHRRPGQHPSPRCPPRVIGKLGNGGWNNLHPRRDVCRARGRWQPFAADLWACVRKRGLADGVELQRQGDSLACDIAEKVKEKGWE